MTQLDIRQLAENGGVNPIAPVTVPEAVKFEDGADLTTAIGSIATIETSPATATHAVGDFIVWNGQLYKVTASIAIGETLSTSTNVSATSVGNELTDVHDYSVAFRNGTIFFKRIGVIKMVRFQLEIPSDISTGTVWFVLPEEYRPISPSGTDLIVDFACIQTNGTFAGIVRFNTSGNVTNEFRAFKAGSVRATFAYI